VVLDGKAYPIPQVMPMTVTWTVPQRRFVCHSNENTLHGEIHIKNSGFFLGFMGIFADVLVVRKAIWHMLQDLPKKKEKHELKLIKSPMPGVLVSLPIAVGDQVRKGQTMAVIEAMKMENAIKSPINGVVTEVLVHKGDNLSRDQIIAKFGT
jgi:propionyl-CoA carboxylase alpha chain